MAKTTLPAETTTTEVMEELHLDPALLVPASFELDFEKQIRESRENGTEPRQMTTEELAALRFEVDKLRFVKAALEAREEEIKDAMRANLDYGKNELDGATRTGVTIGRNPQFQAERFEEAYPYDDTAILKDQAILNEKGNPVVRDVIVYPNRKFYKITPNVTAIKAELPKAEVDDFYIEGQKKVLFN